MMRNERGFTVIELLLAVVIIGILATLVIPKFGDLRNRSMDAMAVSDVKQMMLVQDQFKLGAGFYADFTVADKVGSTVSVVVQGQPFAHHTLSDDVEMLCLTSASGVSGIIVAKHIGSTRMIGIDLNFPGLIRKLETTGALADAAIPASTTGDDLSAWDRF